MNSQAYQKIIPYTRSNLPQREIKTMDGYIADGTALNASDPNSMRDLGMLRNAEHYVRI